MDLKKEEETIDKAIAKQRDFWYFVFLPFKIARNTISIIFGIIRTLTKIASIILLIFIIWFGYNFYIVFSELTERGTDKESAAMEAFDATLDSTLGIFSRISGVIDVRNLFIESYAEEGNVREFFIETRGIPEVYFLTISYDKIKEGVPIKRDKPLQFEVWFYGEPYNNRVVFENGFFKEEKKITDTDDFVENGVSPLVFNEKTSKGEVQGIFGKPSCILSEKAGDDVLTTYRFKETENTPLASVTFVNENIISVTAGTVFLSNDEEKLCK